MTLVDERARVRDASARVLGLIGWDAKGAEARLLAALELEKDLVVLHSDIWALGQISATTAVPNL
jgi:hypothetical protein